MATYDPNHLPDLPYDKIAELVYQLLFFCINWEHAVMNVSSIVHIPYSIKYFAVLPNSAQKQIFTNFMVKLPATHCICYELEISWSCSDPRNP